MVGISQTDLGTHLPLVAKGKVREIYDLDGSRLLFVATDRISAYDVNMANAIDQKGALLTQLSKFWFTLLQYPQSPEFQEFQIPGLQTHLISMGLPHELKSQLSSEEVSQLEPRSMIVKKLSVFPIESIVRGYITGSAWSSYQINGTVCGISLPPGLQESEKLEQPLWTPSTKAEPGGKDQNISPTEAMNMIGKDHTTQIQELSLQIYNKASRYAAERGIIIADTKFEFGLDESTGSVVLIDEVLTPDSSRFWEAATYEIGQGQKSFDKQHLRDWLELTGQKGKEDVEMPKSIVTDTLERYKQAYSTLVGTSWDMR